MLWNLLDDMLWYGVDDMLWNLVASAQSRLHDS